MGFWDEGGKRGTALSVVHETSTPKNNITNGINLRLFMCCPASGFMVSGIGSSCRTSISSHSVLTVRTSVLPYISTGSLWTVTIVTISMGSEVGFSNKIFHQRPSRASMVPNASRSTGCPLMEISQDMFWQFSLPCF